MKILIIKTSALGDIVHAFPVVQYLYACNHTVDWLVESPFSTLVSSHPYVNKVIEINTKSWRKKILQSTTYSEIRLSVKNLRSNQYDLVIDLQRNTKSSIFTLLAKAKMKIGFNRHAISEWPNLLVTHKKYSIPPQRNIREDYFNLVKIHFQDIDFFVDTKIILNINDSEKEFLESYFRKHNINADNCIMICPGAHWKNKQLGYNQLCQFLRKVYTYECQPTFILIWGNEKERILCESLKNVFKDAMILEKLSLPLLQNFMSKIKRVIAMDSLPLHLAGTTNTPTFGLFGPSSPKKYSPTGNNNHYFFGKCPYNHNFESRCGYLRTCKTGACLKEAAPEEIFKDYLENNCVKK